MNFPVSPSDGQLATVNNIQYQYSTATNTWTRTADPFTSISSTGNITTNGYFIGNGSQLTGITGTYGNANVAAYLASGTDTSNIITTGNITGANITTGGLLSAAGTITSGVNLFSPLVYATASTGFGLDVTANAKVGGLITATGNITSAGNIAGAQAATAANRVNQATPYGSLNYSQTGTDAYGNPTYTASQTYSPEVMQGLSGLTGQINQNIAGGFNPQLPSYGINPNETYSDAIMRRLEPLQQRQQSQLENQLANQGIMRGSEAYEQAQRDLAMKQNDLSNQAALSGLQAQQQFFGQGLQAGQFGNTAQQQMLQNQALQAQLANQARSQGFQELAYQRNEPINTLNAVRSGSQVTNPNQFYVSVPQQATTTGADLMSAAQATGNANIANANAQNAYQNALMSGMFKLGGSLAA